MPSIIWNPYFIAKAIVFSNLPLLSKWLLWLDVFAFVVVSFNCNRNQFWCFETENDSPQLLGSCDQSKHSFYFTFSACYHYTFDQQVYFYFLLKMQHPQISQILLSEICHGSFQCLLWFFLNALMEFGGICLESDSKFLFWMHESYKWCKILRNNVSSSDLLSVYRPAVIWCTNCFSVWLFSLAVQTEHSQRGVGVCASYHEHHHAAGVSAGSVSNLSHLVERVGLHHH